MVVGTGRVIGGEESEGARGVEVGWVVGVGVAAGVVGLRVGEELEAGVMTPRFARVAAAWPLTSVVLKTLFHPAQRKVRPRATRRKMGAMVLPELAMVVLWAV